MALQTINTGTTDNDGTGDSPKVAYGKCNNNATELYTRTSEIAPDTDPTDRDTGTPFASPYLDSTGGVIAGLDADGRFAFKPSPDSRTWVKPAAMRAHSDVTNIRFDGNDGVVAQWQDSDGKICDIYQQMQRSSESAIAISSRGIRYWLGVGQSHLTEFSGIATVLAFPGNPFPKHVVTIENAFTHGGDSLWSDTAEPTNDFIPAIPVNGATADQIVRLVLIALTQFERDAGIVNPVRVGTVSSKGSMPIEEFFPAQTYFMHENAVEEATRVAECAARYPLSFAFDFIFFLQGENNNTTATPWGTQFADWVDASAVPLYMAAAGVATAPKIILMQTGTASNDATPNANPLEQLAFARSRPTTTALAGPMYPYPLYPTSQVHVDNLSRLRIAEVGAIAALHLEAGTPFPGLRPVAGGATRVGNVITIPMELPPGCTTLVFDDDTVGLSGVTNEGFVFSQTGGNSPVITNVAISGTDIVITLDVTPTGTAMLVSGGYANDTGTTGWMTGRTTLYTPDPRPSVFNRLGYDVPANPRHFCAEFQESVP